METLQTERRTLTVAEVATVLGLARSTAYELAATDRLPVPTIRVGRRLLVSRAALERVLASEPIRSSDGASPEPAATAQDAARRA